VADLDQAPARAGTRRSTTALAALAAWWRPYRAVLTSRVRAQTSYRGSFALDLASSVLIGLVELAEIWVLYRSVDALGGLDLAAVLLVFGIADTAFSTADLFVGHVDTLPRYLRAGTLDVFYLRPQPLLAQLVTSEISLRRVTRIGVGLTALAVGLAVNDIAWSPLVVAFLVVVLLASTLTFAGLFVAAAGVQFFLVDASEMTNAVVYGGRYAATQPASVWGKPLVALFGFAVPIAFTAYLPVVALLGLPGAEWLPSWLGWLAPLAAVWTWAVALLAWRTGVRHYQGGGG
jgi:ABC-2 type transport system permease protein